MIARIRAALKRLRTKVPDVVFRYCLPVVSLAVIVGGVYLSRHFWGPRNPTLYLLGILYVVLFLGSAWLGYGPGLLICFLSLASQRILGRNPCTWSADVT